MNFNFLIPILAICATASPIPWPNPGEAYPTAVPSGGWTFYTDARAIQYKGVHDKVYAGMVDRQGSVRIWSMDLKTAQTDTFTLHYELKHNDHNNPSLYVRKDGRLMAFYQKHGTDSSARYRVSKRPEDISDWEPEQVLKMPEGVSYAHVFLLGNRLYLFNRSIGYHPTLTISEDEGSTWGPSVKLIGGSGARPYVKYVSDGKSRVHIAFTDGHPQNEPTNSIYYAYLENGAFHRADGSKIKELAQGPLEPSEADKVYDGTLNPKAWIWDIALDSAGRPAMVYAVFPALTDHRYHYARWNGTAWGYAEITKAGSWFPQTIPGTPELEPYYSGGIILDHHQPDQVYLARQVDGIFEIERWSTEDGGKTFLGRPVTSGSTKPNARPFLPWTQDGRPPSRKILLWMNGDYVFYKDYQTGIRYYLWPDEPVSLRPGRAGSGTRAGRLRLLSRRDPGIKASDLTGAEVLGPGPGFYCK